MPTFVKVILLILLVILMVHFWPILIAPFVLVALAMLLLGGLTAGGIAIVLAAGLALVGGVLAVALSIAAALSPIWIPILLVVGLVWLCKTKSSSTV